MNDLSISHLGRVQAPPHDLAKKGVLHVRQSSAVSRVGVALLREEQVPQTFPARFSLRQEERNLHLSSR